MPYFNYLKDHRKFKNYRRKLAIAPFFAEFHVLRGEISLTVFIRNK